MTPLSPGGRRSLDQRGKNDHFFQNLRRVCSKWPRRRARPNLEGPKICVWLEECAKRWPEDPRESALWPAIYGKSRPSGGALGGPSVRAGRKVSHFAPGGLFEVVVFPPPGRQKRVSGVQKNATLSTGAGERGQKGTKKGIWPEECGKIGSKSAFSPRWSFKMLSRGPKSIFARGV